MALLNMQKMRFYVHRDAGESFFSELQRLGSVEFVRINDTLDLVAPESDPKIAKKSAETEVVVDFLAKYESPMSMWQKLRKGSKFMISEGEIQNIKKINIEKYHSDVKDLQIQLNNCDSALKVLTEEKSLLEPWKGLDIEPAETAKNSKLHLTFIGYRVESKIIEEKLGSVQKPYFFMSHAVGLGVLLFFKEDQRLFESLFPELDIQIMKITQRPGMPADIIKEIHKEESNIIEKRAGIEKRAKIMAGSLTELRLAADYFLWEAQKQSAIVDGKSTGRVLIYEGWVPKNIKTGLLNRLGQITDKFAIEDIEPGPNEEIPVEIHNNPFVRPFESVTRLYGLPGSRDLDPTAYLAGFFFIFFGFALSDFGYGFLLLSAALAARYFFVFSREVRLMLLLLALGGLSAMIMGLLFGGVFGIAESSLPAFLVALKYFDPISSPIVVLGLALTLGVIQILFGLVLDIVSAYKNGEFWECLQDKGPWLLMFLAIIASGLDLYKFIAFPYAIYIVYLSMGAVVISGGREEKGVLKKIGMGVVSLYGVVGYFSDILSYSRLLALGLATTAIAFAVNTIAFLMRDLIPVVGFAVMVGVMIVGHLFNLAVNTLGAFIHGARLQFVEFFTKFIKGSGRIFQPFSRRERYFIIK